MNASAEAPAAPAPDLRLLPAAAGAWTAAFVATLGTAAAMSMLGVSIVLGIAVFSLRDVRPLAHIRSTVPALLLGAAAAVAVSVCALAAHPARQPPALLETLPAAVEVHGAVTSSCRGVTAGTICTATARVDPVGDHEAADRIPVLLFLPAEEALLPPPFGAQVDGFGSGRTLAPEDSAAVMVSVDRLEWQQPGGPLGWAAGLRAGFGQAASALPGDGGALLPGLAIGDTSAVDESLDAAMKTSSLSHLTAVSGANCALVIAGATGLAALIGLGRRTRVAVALTALGLFVLLVTPEPSVVRAATMGVIALVGVVASRGGGGVPALGATVVLLLCLDPWLGRNYGFALSVLATGGLLLLARPLGRWLGRWLPPRLAAALALPMAAQLACQPVLVLLDPSVAVYGVPANLLAAPAAPIATVLGMLACILLPVVPVLGAGLAWLAWLPAAWIGGCARLFSELPGARAGWLPGATGAVLLAIVTTLCLIAVLARAGRLQRIAGTIGLGSIVFAVLAGGVGWVSRMVHRPTDWVIAACDVGQGDALLLRSAAKVALVDTGPDPAALDGCLTDLGVDRIHLLVLTHWDADHDGGLAAVTGRVDSMLHGPPADDGDRFALDALVASGTHAVAGTRGMTGTLGSAAWRVLWPTSASVPPGNDAGVTVEVTGLGPEVPPVVLLADLGADGQRGVLAAGVPPTAVGGIVKVAHHGSVDQAPELYDALQPVLSIVSVGAGNDYGHPRPESLAMLRDLGSAVVRTDLDGLVLVGADATGLWMWSAGAAPP